MSVVNNCMPVLPWSLTRLPFFHTQLQGLKVFPIHQEMHAIQSAAYGEKSASKANQK